jgi:hypothetical protein
LRPRRVTSLAKLTRRFWVRHRDAKPDAVTRHEKSTAFTIEKLACDCLDVRDLRRKGILGSLDWITFRPML